MRYGIFILALGVLWSSQVSAGELQSVYEAPGGVYIASAHVHVGTENDYPTYGAPGPTYYAPPAYAPGYVPPGQVYRAPAFYEGYRSVYPARPAYIDHSEYFLHFCGRTSAAAARPCAIQRRCALFIQPSLWSVGIL
jgi:hypothetical protein